MATNNEKSQVDNIGIIEFLKKEYEITFNCWKFGHEDRSKYVAIFVSLLAGTGFLFFKSIEACKFSIAIFIAMLSGVINILFLKWFIAHRASALEYLHKLNQIRNKLFDLSGADESIKDIILSTKRIRITPDNNFYSREYEFYRIIILLISLNFSAAIYILFRYKIFILKGCWVEGLILIIFIGGIYFFSKDKYFKKYIMKELEKKDSDIMKKPGA